jgi:DNA (cytosine-5)-methyltransferase 1
MSGYYCEFDSSAAAWLRELMKTGLIPEGKVDERDIREVRPEDVRGFTQAHFFAGIGGWPYALRLAGWPDDRPVWTGSCPCQPFSAAGKRQGQADERHVWPVFFRLIRQCNPATVFGEQVASDDGYRWLARVRDDLEDAGYAVGCADLPACSAGAPHIRQRLFWVANANSSERRQKRSANRRRAQSRNAALGVDAKDSHRLADANGGLAGDGGIQPGREHGQQPEDGGVTERVGNTNGTGREGRGLREGERADQCSAWQTAISIPCRDGKARRIEPAIFPLAHGIPGRVGLLRGAGNAIVPQVAAAFVRAFLEAEAELTHAS